MANKKGRASNVRTPTPLPPGPSPIAKTNEMASTEGTAQVANFFQRSKTNPEIKNVMYAGSNKNITAREMYAVITIAS